MVETHRCAVGGGRRRRFVPRRGPSSCRRARRRGRWLVSVPETCLRVTSDLGSASPVRQRRASPVRRRHAPRRPWQIRRRRMGARAPHHRARRCHRLRGHHPAIRHQVHHLVPGRRVPRRALPGRQHRARPTLANPPSRFRYCYFRDAETSFRPNDDRIPFRDSGHPRPLHASPVVRCAGPALPARCRHASGSRRW